MNITYHVVPASYFEDQDPSKDYVPADFQREGFIHCTDGEFRMSVKANKYYANVEGDLLLFVIDKSKVKSKIQYDDPEKMFSHIYGPLNRDAIVKISKMIRDQRGEWIFPTSIKFM